MTSSDLPRAQDPTPEGLYLPAFEHDACGVGMICNLNNRKSHGLVKDALQILANLTHRGACGCDETTGDGAGILIQKPHRFLEKACRETAIHLPAKMDYAAGLVFLPTDRKRRLAAQAAIADATKAKGLDFLGWRWALPDRNRKPSWPSGTLPWMIAETSAPEVTT